MANNVLINAINEKISTFDTDPNSLIVVLKGIPLTVADPDAERIDISEIVSNKLRYFMSFYGKRKYITYEEFLLLSELIVLQYKEIIILNNNLYMEQYPVEECFPQTIREGLLTHFSEEDNDEDAVIGDIEEYTSIFEGIKEFNGYLMGVYCKVPALKENKVITINIFDEASEDIIEYGTVNDFIEIEDESDYLIFIKKLFVGPDELYVRVTNYSGDLNRLKAHLNIAAHYWQEYTDVYYIQIQSAEVLYEHRTAYTEILEKHWGYSSFRELSVYDMNKLEQNEKAVMKVSQEQIISNLVTEVEHCGEGKDYRDIFCTAPTGAGKSVMFQIPAIYLAEKYNLLTIVISPLIGLMNDQIKNLELKQYTAAKTINSDISPIIKQDIIDKVSDGQYHILYISPETLLSRSDVEQLIGDRTIGMIVIDEAHIVTTWGKQFRPDYWYLGDHIRKLRKNQIEKKGRSFVIATFTATAIYHGLEDMYTETINSLHMINPITYLGYVKREDIDINIKKEEAGKKEYELNKFEQVEKVLKRAILTNKKTLVYFPTVALIDRCYEYLRTQKMISKVAIYYGTLDKSDKQENYEMFLAKEKILMLATKAFGMGIDIDDIEIVMHFAPTGNVCDYVQEIGRAARRPDLEGEAVYTYNTRDFKHINRLHGMSMIQKYQLVSVIEKIDELHQKNLRSGKRKDLTKKRNTMLLDAENFSYIFKSPISDEDDNINKVKTALLLIQKDFEAKFGFSPINVRPIPLFSIGYFKVDPKIQASLLRSYKECLTEIESKQHICRIRLDYIWNRDFKTLSFPKFKFLLYSKNYEQLDFIRRYPMEPALCVSVSFSDDCTSIFNNIWDAFRTLINRKLVSGEQTDVDELVQVLVNDCNMNKYKAQSICEVVIASMDSYRKNFAQGASAIVSERVTNNGKIKYEFKNAVNNYFNWVSSGLSKIKNMTVDGQLFIVNDNGSKTKECNVILGVLEAMDVLSFEMIGGANSQLYIYINQTRSLKEIINDPGRYQNRLLETISSRHIISVKMLTYLYEGNFSSKDRWNIIEDYFLGSIPEKVKSACQKENSKIIF